MKVYVVRVKPGVTFAANRPPADWRLSGAIDSLCGLMQRDILVTCGSDGHKAPDPHVSGEAYDVGVVGWSVTDIIAALLFLRDKLGAAFYVQYETPLVPSDERLRRVAVVSIGATGPHFHLQRARLTLFPPVVA